MKKEIDMIEFVMNAKLVKNIMLDLGADINLLPTRVWK